MIYLRTKWNGDETVLIDRFDVRSHLDYIPENKETAQPEHTAKEKEEERMLNYERYRTLVQNEAVGSKQI